MDLRHDQRVATTDANAATSVPAGKTATARRDGCALATRVKTKGGIRLHSGPVQLPKPTGRPWIAVTAGRDPLAMATRVLEPRAHGGQLRPAPMPRGAASARPFPQTDRGHSTSGDHGERPACEGNTVFAERPHGRASWADLPRVTDGGCVGKAVTAGRDPRFLESNKVEEPER